MKGPEANFYNTLVRNFPEWDFQRIETLTSNGVPDVHVCIPPGTEFWVELKAPNTKNGATNLRMEQYAWGMKRANKGGNVWVFSKYLNHIKAWRFPIEVAPSSKGHVSIISPPTFTRPLTDIKTIKENL